MSKPSYVAITYNENGMCVIQNADLTPLLVDLADALHAGQDGYMVGMELPGFNAVLASAKERLEDEDSGLDFEDAADELMEQTGPIAYPEHANSTYSNFCR